MSDLVTRLFQDRARTLNTIIAIASLISSMSALVAAVVALEIWIRH